MWIIMEWLVRWSGGAKERLLTAWFLHCFFFQRNSRFRSTQYANEISMAIKIVKEKNTTITESGGVGPKVLEKYSRKSKITSVQSPHLPILFLAWVKEE